MQKNTKKITTLGVCALLMGGTLALATPDKEIKDISVNTLTIDPPVGIKAIDPPVGIK